MVRIKLFLIFVLAFTGLTATAQATETKAPVVSESQLYEVVMLNFTFTAADGETVTVKSGDVIVTHKDGTVTKSVLKNLETESENGGFNVYYLITTRPAAVKPKQGETQKFYKVPLDAITSLK